MTSHAIAPSHASTEVPVKEPTRSGVARGGMLNAIGTVTGALPGGIYSVKGDDGLPMRCMRAASCLLRPAVGDTVLVSGPDTGRLYLTAVVEQADASASRIDVAGDLTLASERGGVRIEGPTQLVLHGGEALRLSAPQLGLEAQSAACQVGQLSYQGEQVEATVLGMRVVGRLYEAVVDRLVHLSKTAFRMTEDVEQVRAGHLDYQAAEIARLHGKNTIVTAKQIVKIDASQIHMG